MFDQRLLEKQHVELAIGEFLRERPVHHAAKSAFLMWQGERLPAKVILTLAFRMATGIQVTAEQHTGGRTSVKILQSLGFETLYDKKPSSQQKTPNRRRQAFFNIVKFRFPDIRCEEKFDKLRIPDFSQRGSISKDLRTVLDAIEATRQIKVSGGKGRKLACDFFIPSIKTAIEFDERQHFTPLRAVSLNNYPSSSRLGFDARQWINLSEEIQAGDNSPIHRDEQRAFYDTLRDINIPLILGFPPVIRVYEKAIAWETIDMSSPEADRLVTELLKRTS